MSFRTFIKSRTGGVVLATTALITLGGVGGAAAAGLITSADIKDNTIKSRDVRNGTLAMKDLNENTRARINAPGEQGPAGPAGPAGSDGADGTNGADGSDGVNAYDEIPTGETVYGAIGADYHNTQPSGTADYGIDASLPMPAAQSITDGDVSVVVSTWQDGGPGQLQPTTTDGNAGCTGTVDAPTAPAGRVCIYVTGADNAVNLEGYTVAFGDEGSHYGFKLKWDVAGEGDTFVDAVWAYTAD